MRISEIHVFQKDLPIMGGPYTWSGNVLHAVDSTIVKLVTDSGVVGWGEVAPIGPDQGSFTDDDGKPIDNGQFFVAFDPNSFSGGNFDQTIDTLVSSITEQEGARLPNARREANKQHLEKLGFRSNMSSMKR